MKKTFILISALLLMGGFMFTSCKKDDLSNPTVTTVRYEFTSDKDANYILRYRLDSSETDETISSRAWSKTITVNKNSVSSTSLTAFAPPDWLGTTNEAHATVRIFVNGAEKASNSGILVGLDRPSGLTATTGVE